VDNDVYGPVVKSNIISRISQYQLSTARAAP
jgi:hypothetical protein